MRVTHNGRTVLVNHENDIASALQLLGYVSPMAQESRRLMLFYQAEQRARQTLEEASVEVVLSGAA